MGLRSHLSLYLVGLLSVLAGLLLLLVQWQGQHKTAQLDELAARVAMQRLMTTLQDSTLSLNGTLKTWAYRSDLPDYFAGRLPASRAKDIGVEALAYAGVDFLALMDMSGLLQGAIEVPGVDGATPMTDELRDNSHLYPAYVKAFSERRWLWCLQGQVPHRLGVLQHDLEHRPPGARTQPRPDWQMAHRRDAA